jgi:hypothetical protein
VIDFGVELTCQAAVAFPGRPVLKLVIDFGVEMTCQEAVAVLGKPSDFAA